MARCCTHYRPQVIVVRAFRGLHCLLSLDLSRLVVVVPEQSLIVLLSGHLQILLLLHRHSHQARGPLSRNAELLLGGDDDAAILQSVLNVSALPAVRLVTATLVLAHGRWQLTDHQHLPVRLIVHSVPRWRFR